MCFSNMKIYCQNVILPISNTISYVTLKKVFRKLKMTLHLTFYKKQNKSIGLYITQLLFYNTFYLHRR